MVIAFVNYVPAKGIFGSKWAGLDYFALMLNEMGQKAVKKTVQPIAIMLHFLSWDILGNSFITVFSMDGLVNSLHLIDGGYFTAGEAGRLYRFLAERSEGRTHIAGWFFSHAHQDHVGVFLNFMEEYGDKAAIDTLYYNFQPMELPAEENDSPCFSAGIFLKCGPPFAPKLWRRQAPRLTISAQQNIINTTRRWRAVFVYKMMIVEDELFVRIGLEHAADWSKYHIQLLPSATNGREALELYEKEHPQLILTDIRMPEMDGLELIAAIRAKDKNVKFIVLSCLEDFQTAKQAINLSISHYYNKSELDLEELTQYVSEIVRELDAAGVPEAVPEPAPGPEGATELAGFFLEGKPCGLDRLLAGYRKDGAAYVLARMDFEDAAEADFALVRSVLLEILDKQKAGHCLAVSPEQAALLYVLEDTVPERQIEQMETFRRHLELSMRSYFHIRAAITISAAFSDLGETGTRWEEVTCRAAKEVLDPLSAEQVSSRKVLDAVRYVQQNLDGDLSLTAVAGHVNFSPGYLSALFKRELDVSFSDFVINARIRRAKFLLTQSDEPLYSIAEQTGFHDASYLVKVFKRYAGMTPNDYRQHYDSFGRRKD